MGGFPLEYTLIYLQKQLKDIGLRAVGSALLAPSSPTFAPATACSDCCFSPAVHEPKRGKHRRQASSEI